MTRPVLGSLLLMVAVTPLLAEQPILECAFNDIGGDLIHRGWYVPAHPSDRLGRVDLQFYAFGAGDYEITLTARQATYDGPVVGVSTIEVSVDIPVDLPEELSGTDTGSGEDLGDAFRGHGVFDFGSVPVPENGTLTFTFDTPPASPFLYFDTGPCLEDSNCADCGHMVIETEGTEPPLDTFRRASVGVVFSEGGEVPAVGPRGLALLVGLLLLLPPVLRHLS